MMGSQIDRLSAGLVRIAARIPELPADEILLTRMMILLGRNIASMIDRVLRPHGLNEQDFRVLMALFSDETGCASPSEIGARVLYSPANMTRISDALVARDLITRALSDKDRRRVVLQLNARGEALVKRLLPTFFEPMRQIFGEFSAVEVHDLSAHLKRFAAALDRINGGVTMVGQ